MFVHYIKSLLKSLKKNRFFHAINIIGFSTGFLLLTIIVTFVYQELSYDRFNKNAKNIYRIQAGGYGVTPPCFADKLKNKIPEIKNIIRFCSENISLEDSNGKLNVGKIYFTDPEIFQVFSFDLLSGNISDVLKGPWSIVISKSKARELFGNNSPMGNTVKDKQGNVYTITGVMEDIPFTSHIQADAFISIETLRNIGNDKSLDCGTWNYLTYLELSDKSDSKDTEKKINIALEEFRMETGDGKIPLKLEPLNQVYFDYDNNKYDGSIHENRQTIMLYLAIAVLILFIAIVNYINLSTVISAGRMKEIGIKRINGARQSQIIRQIVVETSGIAIISFCIALLLIGFLLPQLSVLLNINISETFTGLQLYLIYFTGIVFIGIITGIIPGIYLSRIQVIKTLKNQSGLKFRGGPRKILLIFQLLIVATLLNSTFIIKNQINYIFEKNLGFNYENVIAFKLDQELLKKKEVVKQKLLENPDVKNISFSDALIGDGFAKSPKGDVDNIVLCCHYSIDPDYFKLYNIKIKYGRNFSWDVATDSSNSCILNEEACRAFGIEDPLNKTLDNKKIIGVVNDFNFTSLHNQIEPLVIYRGNQGIVAQIKISGINQKNTLQYIGEICKNSSPDFDFNYTFLKDKMSNKYKPEMNLKNSFQFYSTVTFIIALLGLFGLTLFLIRKKTKEVAIRKLFGARLTDTIKRLTKEQILITVIANIIAVPVTYTVIMKWLNNFQYRIDIGYMIFLKTLIITISFTLLTVVFLIIKVHKIDLIKSLKHE